MKANITIMSGDGVGPEITREAVKALQAIETSFGHDFTLEEVLFGGIAIDKTGSPYPEETQRSCKSSDAVLLGAVGGPKWSDPNMKVRPEKEGLLAMRADLGIYANIRPIKTYPQLIESSPIKNRYLDNIDIVFVRELTGGIYFGKKRKTETSASDICEYSKVEIEKIKKGGQKAVTIVQDLLTLARRGVIVSDVVDVNQVVSEYLKSLEYEKLNFYHPKVEVEPFLETNLLNILGSAQK